MTELRRRPGAAPRKDTTLRRRAMLCKFLRGFGIGIMILGLVLSGLQVGFTGLSEGMLSGTLVLFLAMLAGLVLLAAGKRMEGLLDGTAIDEHLRLTDEEVRYSCTRHGTIYGWSVRISELKAMGLEPERGELWLVGPILHTALSKDGKLQSEQETEVQIVDDFMPSLQETLFRRGVPLMKFEELPIEEKFVRRSSKY